MEKLENGLYYTDDDILTLYRDAKDKKAQIKILSELNLCSTDDIRTALLRAGLDYRALPRTRKNNNIESDINTSIEESDNINDKYSHTEPSVIYGLVTTDNIGDKELKNIVIPNTYKNCLLTSTKVYHESVTFRLMEIRKGIEETEAQLKALKNEYKECEKLISDIDSLITVLQENKN